MKKILLTLSAAALVLASCAKIETVKVDENRAISFSNFVSNQTKAVTNVTTADLTAFYVFGDYNEGASIAFSNTKVTGKEGGDYTPENPAYWITDKTYEFAAYADGNDGKLEEGISFSNGTLTISGYTVDDAKDLIAATASEVSAPAAGNDQKVALTFHHLLSKVKFTFSTVAVPEAFRMEVSNLTFNAIKTGASCSFSNNNLVSAWTGTNGDYTIATLGDYAVTGGSASTDDILVIPQVNTGIEVSFTVTIYDENKNTEIATKEYTASIATTEGWKAGYMYNYTATINPNDVNDQLKPITFTVDEVKGWEEESNVITPTVPQP